VAKPDPTASDDATGAPKAGADGTEPIAADPLVAGTVIPPGIPGTPVHLPTDAKTNAKAKAAADEDDKPAADDLATDGDLATDEDLDDEDLADDDLDDADLIDEDVDEDDLDDDLDQDDLEDDLEDDDLAATDEAELVEEIPEEFETGEDEQTPQTALFWQDAEIDPVEVALPSGVGLTLRHYRTTEDSDGDEAEEAVFLAHKGKLQLFKTAEALVEFINSDAPHDLTDLETWAQVKRRCRAADIVADEDDRYELDLVVENLRGGHDAWDPDLLISAGEFARDVAFACELTDVLAILAPGSPLDDMDEALRDGGFMARRRLKKVGVEQAAIAWRSVVGKISAATEWHG
jgi:hypothetical protein